MLSICRFTHSSSLVQHIQLPTMKRVTFLNLVITRRSDQTLQSKLLYERTIFRSLFTFLLITQPQANLCSCEDHNIPLFIEDFATSGLHHKAPDDFEAFLSLNDNAYVPSTTIMPSRRKAIVALRHDAYNYCGLGEKLP